jgi:hypothetical protein
MAKAKPCFNPGGAANFRPVKGGIAVLQDIMDEAFSMGRYAKKKAKKASSVRQVDRKVAWPTGRTILRVRHMTKAELVREGWGSRGGGIALDLNDGGILYASRDDEGNGPGVFFAISPKGEAVRVHPLS